MSPAVRSSSTGSPRPCLKRCQSSPAPVSPTLYPSHPIGPSLDTSVSYMSPHPSPAASSSRVHFPPTPTLSTTFLTHSKSTYDRRPLVVQPNDCAIPERGCPGRTYVLERSNSYPNRRNESAVTPMRSESDAMLALPSRASHVAGVQGSIWTRAPGDDILDIVINEDEEEPPSPYQHSSLHSPSSSPSSSTSTITPTTPTPRSVPTALPSLIPDHGPSSSESDESDALTSPNASRFLPSRTSSGLKSAPSSLPSEEERLLFLPHPPSSDLSKPRIKDKEEREARRRRRREIEEERGKWKTSIPVKDEMASGCFGGF